MIIFFNNYSLFVSNVCVYIIILFMGVGDSKNLNGKGGYEKPGISVILNVNWVGLIAMISIC